MKPKPGKELLYLSQADVVAAGVTPAEINARVEAAFRDEAAGTAWTEPKLMISRPDGASFRAKAGAMASPGYGALKWFGYFPGNSAKGHPDFSPLILLNEGETGLPVAVMDGVWISAVRTGSVTAVAARYMARPGAETAGFVACGAQAYSNLDALMAEFPLHRVTAYSRTLASAERFAEAAKAKGLEARAVADPRAAVNGQDIVVTSIPHTSAQARFLDAADVSPGTFVSMVDLGFGWRKDTLTGFDRVVTDNIRQSGPGGAEKLNFDGTYAGDLADVVSGRLPGRMSGGERSALIFAGTGHVDLAAAVAVYEAACAKGLGTMLPL